MFAAPIFFKVIRLIFLSEFFLSFIIKIIILFISFFLKNLFKLIKSNLRLVIKIAKEFRNVGLDYEDLISEGNIGLTTAIDKYDLEKGAKLSNQISSCGEFSGRAKPRYTVLSDIGRRDCYH